MKKRLLSLVLCLVMVFSLLPFGASAEVYLFEGNAIQVEFYKSSEAERPFNTQRVLTNGTDSIYDPGCELEENTVFLGWQVNGQGETMNIADVRAYVAASVSAGETVKLVASVSPVHYVVYYDEANPARVIKTVAVIYAKNNNKWNTTADLDYNPVNNSNDFYGWKTADGTLLGKNADITDLVAENATTALYPDCRTGSWITFNENDKWTNADGLEVNIHATYRAPAFIEQDGSIDISDSKYNVSAEGYNFAGWFTEAGEGPLSTVNQGQTVYAHWTAKDNIEYKVAYWKQNANDDGYSLVANDIETKTGTAGEEATYDSEAIQNKYQYFHLNTDLSDAAKERVVIAGDGSTIRNVYFDRDEYTLTFISDSITYVYYGRQYSDATIGDINTSSNWINRFENSSNKVTFGDYVVSKYNSYYAIKIAGDWYDIDRYGSYVYSAESIVDPAIKTITAKYEENISGNFPIAGYSGYVWAPQNSSVYTTGDVPFIENMKPENTVFKAETYGSGTTIHFYYYTEATGREGSDVTKVTYGGKTYVEHQHVQISSDGGITSTENEDFIDIEGYKHNGSNPSYSGGSVAINSSNNYTMKFYYARETYRLKFISNGSTVHTTTALYQEALNGKAPENFKIGETTRTDSSGKILIFQGWYDNADFAGNAYNFAESYMPSNDLIFYAQWSPVKHRVVLDANTGKFVTGGGEVNTIDFTVKDGGTVEPNNPVKDNYNFIGWYTDENLTQRFNLSTRVTGDVLTAPNYPVAPETDPDSSVRGKLTLYAKWRPKMNANTYILVKYDADGGTVNGEAVYTDPLHYAAAAEAVAQPAAAPASEDAGKSFRAWQILNAADEVVGEVLPGNVFNVNLADAEETTVDGKTVYVVTLKADYAVATSTHIVWYGNGGTTADGAATVESADANVNAAIAVKPAKTFTREGYVFLGWARLNETDENGVKNPEVVDAEGNFINQNLTEADLWLTWDGEHYTAVNNAGTTVTDPDIAANEVLPHHVLYAVWEKTTPATYLIDFGAQMKLAENGSIKKGSDTHNNGKFSVVNNAAVYQLKADQKISDAKTEVVDLTMSGVDSATIHGNFYVKNSETGAMVTEAKAAWKDVTVVPASSVYFDDSFTTPITVGDGSGFNSDLDGKNVNSTADPAQGRMTFTFYGTRADFYCTTTSTGKTVRAYITKDSTGEVMDTVSMKNQSTEARYNVPTVSFDMGAADKYTVTFVDLYGDYKIDGVRIYNSVAELAGTEEADAHYIKLHDKLVSSIDAGGVTEGVAFHMDKDGAQLSEYAKEGPKNEIYLDENEYVAFEIKDFDKYEGTPKVMVGLSVQGAANGTVQLNGNDSQYVKSVIDEYYVVDVAKTGDSAGIVFIKNLGDKRIAVTNLKITGVTGVDVNYSARALAVAEEPAAEVEAFEPKLIVTSRLLSFMENPVFPEADSGEQEDPTPTPTFQDLVRQLLSSFVKALFGSISRLFGN